MKIIVLPPATNRNEDMANNAPMPVIVVPDSSLVKDDKPVFIPELSHNYGICPAFAVRIGKVGKHIQPQFASRYTEAIAPAVWMLDINDTQTLGSSSYPWAWGTSFDGAVVTGKWKDFTPYIGKNDYLCQFSIGPKKMPPYAEIDMSFMHAAPQWQVAISAISKRFTLKMGDIIIMGPATPLPIDRDYHVRVVQENDILLDYNIK